MLGITPGTLGMPSVDRIDRGYQMLAAAAIAGACTRPDDPESRRINREFALYSPLITHWADVAQYDEVRVRAKILDINQEEGRPMPNPFLPKVEHYETADKSRQPIQKG